MPKVVFWNLSASKTFPALSTDKNVSMLSGYSINALEAVLADVELQTPYQAMIETITSTRYSPIKV